MFFPGDLKRSFTAGKMQYLLFQVLLEVGQLNDQLTPEPSVHVRMPADMETPVFALSPFYATTVDK
jgi:hypothetical protein